MNKLNHTEIMNARAGEHVGRSMADLLMNEPSYIRWMLDQDPNGPLLMMKTEAERLIAIFDGRPFLNECGTSGCNNLATRCSVYGDSLAPFWWCSTCDPHSAGARPRKLQLLDKYMDAVRHVKVHCAGRKSDYKRLVRYLAAAKGMPKRMGAPQLAAFFA